MSGKLDGITYGRLRLNKAHAFSFARNGEGDEIDSFIIYVTVQMNNESYPIA